VGTAVGGVIGGVEGVFGINHQHRASYSEFEAAPPPRVYRQRKAWRGKKKVVHRAHRGPAPGYVN
jgi:hypothetical protein